jgi:branched-chain amino acid transport system ATP-binding protein
MLRLENIHVGYGDARVLHGVSLSVNAGELVCLLGRNGAGKTTTLKAISGLLRTTSGAIQFAGNTISGLPAHRVSRAGVKLVPEHRGIFAVLTVEENLKIAIHPASPWTLESVYAMFPRLYERRANGGSALSGGEQQMLAIARALVNGPQFLMLDEPGEGLAPVIVDEIIETCKKVRAAGIPILLVEQSVDVCMELGDRHYILEEGRIVYEGTRSEFAGAHDVRDRYLAVNVD